MIASTWKNLLASYRIWCCLWKANSCPGIIQYSISHFENFLCVWRFHSSFSYSRQCCVCRHESGWQVECFLDIVSFDVRCRLVCNSGVQVFSSMHAFWALEVQTFLSSLDPGSVRKSSVPVISLMVSKLVCLSASSTSSRKLLSATAARSSWSCWTRLAISKASRTPCLNLSEQVLVETQRLIDFWKKNLNGI